MVKRCAGAGAIEARAEALQEVRRGIDARRVPQVSSPECLPGFPGLSRALISEEKRCMHSRVLSPCLGVSARTGVASQPDGRKGRRQRVSKLMRYARLCRDPMLIAHDLSELSAACRGILHPLPIVALIRDLQPRRACGQHLDAQQNIRNSIFRAIVSSNLSCLTKPGL